MVSLLPRCLGWGLVLAVLVSSCSTLPYQNGPRFDDPPVMGTELVPLDRFLALTLDRNPSLGRQKWTELWEAYRDACQVEGVNQAVALAQMLHETGWQRFGGTVEARQNNFAGLGTVDARTPGLSFPDVRTGALAHVQHLKAYGSTDPLRSTMVDPRFRYVKRGSAPTLRSLTGRWAADPRYGDKLIQLYRALWGRG